MDKLFTALTGGSRRQKRRISSIDTMVGKRGIAHTSIKPVGTVLIEGEVWRAHCESNVKRGESVVVVGTRGALLEVNPTP